VCDDNAEPAVLHGLGDEPTSIALWTVDFFQKLAGKVTVTRSVVARRHPSWHSWRNTWTEALTSITDDGAT